MEQINYQGYAGASGFKPGTNTDYAAGMQREQDKQRRADEAYGQALRRNNQQRVENSKRVGQDLLDLSKFSKTLTEVTTQVYKQTQDDILIGEVYDALVNPDFLNTPEAQAEEAQIQQQSDQATLAAGAVAEAEQSGNTEVASYVRSSGEMTAAGYRGQRGALMAAQSAYGPWMTSYAASDAEISINGQTMTMREAMASGDPAVTATAVAQGRYEFIRAYGLGNATKTQFVRFMRGVMPNVDSQLTTNAISTAAKGQREEARSQLSGAAFTSTQNIETDTGSLQTAWDQLSERYWQEGGFATRGQANQAAIEGIISGMVARGDVEGLNNLLDVLKVNGKDGTQLGSQYGAVIDAGIQEATRRRNGNRQSASADVMAGMYEQLSDDSLTVDQRDDIVEQTAQQLEDNGDWQAARSLRQDRNELTVDGSSQRNAAELAEQIRAGEIVSASQLDQQVQIGNITASQYTTLVGQLQASQGASAPENSFASDLARAEIGAFESDFLSAVGLRRDAGGNLIASTTNETLLVTEGDAERIVAQAEADINLLVNAELTRLGPGATDAEVRAAVTRVLGEWRQSEVQSEGGRYRLDDITAARNQTNGKDSTFAAQSTAANWSTRFDSLTTPQAGAYVPPGYSTRQDYSSRTTQGGWTSANASDYNGLRGDRVMQRAELDATREQYEEGTITPELRDLADTLGLSPLALIQQQSNAFGLPPVDPFTDTGSSSRYDKGQLTSYEGAQLIMLQGVPARGAAWLSGNIQQESSWNGKRTWGEVAGDGSDRNGGLVSWMDDEQRDHWRLRDIESYLGKPIDQATNSEQVAAMLNEMRTNYPDAYATFMNPYATDRQLIDASIAYWGYGHEGDRYSYARTTEQQLNG